MEHTPAIKDNIVKTDMDSMLLVVYFSDSHIKQRPFICLNYLMRHLCPFFIQCLFFFCHFQLSDIRHVNMILGSILQYALHTIRLDNNTHHPMPLYQQIPCRLCALSIKAVCIQFKITVRCNISQFIQSASAKPVSILHIG